MRARIKANQPRIDRLLAIECGALADVERHGDRMTQTMRERGYLVIVERASDDGVPRETYELTEAGREFLADATDAEVTT